MLLIKEVEVELNGKNVKWFEDKGYEIPRRKTKWGDISIPSGTKILVKVEDLPHGSDVKMEVKCDCCGKIVNPAWRNYIKRFYKDEDKYYCNACSTKLFRSEKAKKTQLLNSQSFQDWCIQHERQDVLDRWDYELNDCNPDEICWGSTIKRYFKCQEGKHKSELRSIVSFVNNSEESINCKQCKMMANTHPHLIKYFANENDAYKYSYGSHKKVLMKCPNCNFEKEITIHDLVNQGFPCSKCGDGISYPEKFMFNLLEQLNINFIKELSKTTFKWCDNKSYDFYIPHLNIICEVHGIQHYEKNGNWGSLEKIQKNDQIKLNLALINDIDHYIVLDCRESTLNWIKNSIMNSKLPILLNFREQDINWSKCDEYSFCNSLIKEVCDLWNSGLKDTKEIADKFKMGRCTVVRYLNQGKKNNWCDYDPEEENKKKYLKICANKSKRTICLNNNKIFSSIREASDFFKILDTNISACCRGKYKSAGKHHETGEKLRWMFYEEYLIMQQNNQIQNETQSSQNEVIYNAI
jgi:hypothetical protein